ncbi:MAG: right-handed parallel beta-helix repeat-containing protein [Pseudolysinimonas sp.]|uniref:right-handed parallel beta-helix repeat-containing protein n=1 Tax=Pseudolysinimonas sp. TaxID=2680009 RepID=UPI003267B921
MKADDEPTERRPVIAIVVLVLVLGLFIVGGVWVFLGSRPTTPEAVTGPTPTALEPSKTPISTPSADGSCAEPTTTVASELDLQSALDGAAPGDVISIAPGRYVGNFTITTSGTASNPITLCGTPDSVLDGGGVDQGYVVHLDGASYWHLAGFTVTNGQKGVMADGTVGSVIEGLTVTMIGDEAIHLRRTSTDNLVTGNQVSATGLRRDKYGEGIYVGTAKSNWCEISDCNPDASDRNVIEGNTIWATTAESIDIKEGTTGGTVRGNSFDGAGLTNAGGDSWVDVKGNDWLIEGNTGVNTPMDGFQTHEIVDGWGTRNTFRGNTAVINGPGFGFSFTPARDNVVTCDNTASGAGSGLSNVSCVSG